MKTKHLFCIALVSVPVFSILRVLQYIFAIDETGLFVTDSLFQKLLSVSIYILATVMAILALVNIFMNKKSMIDCKTVAKVPLTSVIFISLCAIQLYGAGYLLGNYIAGESFDYICIFKLLSAIFFGLYGVYMLSSRVSHSALLATGFFAPIYAVMLGVRSFFSSFESAHNSYNKLEIITLCAMALMLICVSGALSGARIRLSRLCSVTMLYTAFASASALGELYVVFTVGKPQNEVLEIVEQILLIPAALLILANIKSTKKTAQSSEHTQEYDDVISDYKRIFGSDLNK